METLNWCVQCKRQRFTSTKTRGNVDCIGKPCLFCSFSRALATLEQTRQDALLIKNVISETKQQLSVATVKSEELLEALTGKATVLEKLKAKLGIGSATLSAFVALIDSEIEEDDTALLQVCV